MNNQRQWDAMDLCDKVRKLADYGVVSISPDAVEMTPKAFVKTFDLWKLKKDEQGNSELVHVIDRWPNSYKFFAKGRKGGAQNGV